MVPMTIEGRVRPQNDVWIADSAVSKHITNMESGFYNVQEIHEPVKIGYGKLIYVTKAGKL